MASIRRVPRPPVSGFGFTEETAILIHARPRVFNICFPMTSGSDRHCVTSSGSRGEVRIGLADVALSARQVAGLQRADRAAQEEIPDSRDFRCVES